MEDIDENLKKLEISLSQLNQKLEQVKTDMEKDRETEKKLEIQFKIVKNKEQEALNEYELEKKKEVLTEYGISKNSEITLHVLRGDGFVTKDLLGKGDPYIKVEFEGITHKSEVLQSLQFDVQWKFKVKNPKSQLVIKAMDQNVLNDDTTGIAKIDLQKYRDQELHEEVVNLIDSFKEAGKVYISIIFKWSNAEKLKQIYLNTQLKTKEIEPHYNQLKEAQKVKRDEISRIELEIQENRRKIQELKFKKQQLGGKNQDQKLDPNMKGIDVATTFADKKWSITPRTISKGAMEPPKSSCGTCKNCYIF